MERSLLKGKPRILEGKVPGQLSFPHKNKSDESRICAVTLLNPINHGVNNKRYSVFYAFFVSANTFQCLQP